MKTKNRPYVAFLAFGMAVAAIGCQTAPKTADDRNTLHNESRDVVADFQQKDARLSHFFDTSYAYAVFPAVGQGAVGVGGAYGHGEVYRNGKMIGYCNLSQGTIGVQAGAQKYSEIIFFQNKATFDAFKANEFTFDASASAIAASSGASATADYEKGVAVFTKADGGLMFQAAIGGQKFTYEPSSAVAQDEP